MTRGKRLVLASALVVGLLFASTTGAEAATRVLQPTLLLKVPVYRQQHRLSCEMAALHMLFRHAGKNIPESTLISGMAFTDLKGDPNLAFVGNIDGRQMATGYGIYWDAVAKVAQNYQSAEPFHRRNLHFLIDRLHDGHPVMVWGSLSSAGRNVSWRTRGGKYIHAINGEHTWVVVGYAGPRAHPTHIYTVDSLTGRRTWSTHDFLVNWSFFQNSGMFLK